MVGITVHPRACGEHDQSADSMPTQCGSSPRMRGTQNSRGRSLAACRFIPAHAGNTPYYTPPLITLEVHPRACGEHAPPTPSPSHLAGSSPRMRGTRRTSRHRTPFQRFIPAHAGNTKSTAFTPSRPSVHPRACGEHLSSHVRDCMKDGSSPRMRGTL